LHDKYPAKSNILVNKKVAEVQLLDDGARVISEDGTVYDGHLIVGADGVHSRIRSEMWRLADARNPSLISPRDKQS
jgi:FAD dependent monooxygenase